MGQDRARHPWPVLLEISRSIWDVAAAEAPPPEERLPQEAMELAHAVQRVSASVDFSSVWSGGEVTTHRRPLALARGPEAMNALMWAGGK